MSQEEQKSMLTYSQPTRDHEVFWMDGCWKPIAVANSSSTLKDLLWHWVMRISKTYLRVTSIQCYLWLLLNSHFLTEAGIQVFILGCFSASLPKTEANWHDVIRDLKRIEELIQSIHIDATLYTESDAHPNCKVTAMKCFLLELRVISHESRNMDMDETVENLIILANSSLHSNGNVTESGCKECEELEEKNIKEFLRSFSHIVQMFINSS
ncbi:interleukin-15 [Trichechus manatus latirostris]|uniref:Interleukin n=1 Tax=Trichechus manatus latirostris TaxID=127582 RepID=A0A2Y9E271_TRIMA|nr:interleukin-15 [Trichechus manatus latirostris]XP_023595493.1 interleukin-15 [Trichechus manatus latirostris]